jgi:hypothetical protein
LAYPSPSEFNLSPSTGQLRRNVRDLQFLGEDRD